MKKESLLVVEELSVEISRGGHTAEVIKGVSFTLEEGGSLALVGESGSGKSTLAKTIMGLLPLKSMRVKSGKILLGDQDLTQFTEQEYTKLRGQYISMVFQDTASALNPVMRIGMQVLEAITVGGKNTREEAINRAKQLLAAVGLPDSYNSYPHELSSGMRQRALIAIALGGKPSILIADEPASALDALTKLQIIELLKSIKEEFKLALLLITHDLGLAAQLSDQVAIMYDGKIVETAPVDSIFNSPNHPYSEGLMAGLPSYSGTKDLKFIPGSHPTLGEISKGCSFAARCPRVMDICKERSPQKVSLSEQHTLSCWSIGAGGQL